MYRISIKEAEGIREIMGKTRNKKEYKKLQALALRGEGYANKEIGKITGIHADMVGRYAKKYREEGIENLLTDGRCGGNNQNMSEEEAVKFLRQFEEAASKGEVVTVMTQLRRAVQFLSRETRSTTRWKILS